MTLRSMKTALAVASLGLFSPAALAAEPLLLAGAAIAGESVLSEAGKNVAKSATNYLDPAIANLLFGDDSFDAEVREIKNYMREQTDRILAQIGEERRHTETNQMKWALDQIELYVGMPEWGAAPFSLDSLYRENDSGTLDDVDAVLRSVSSDLLWPQNKTFTPDFPFDFDFDEQIPADIDRLHRVILVSALRLQFISILATAKCYTPSRVSDMLHPTYVELMTVQKCATDEQALGRIHQLLNDLDSYLVASDAHSLFLRRSNERIRFSWGYPCGGNYPSTGLIQGSIRKNDVGADPGAADAQVWSFVYQADGLRAWYGGMPPVLLCAGGSTQGTYRITGPDGSVVLEGQTTREAFISLITNHAGSVAYEAYHDFLLASYGAVLPTLIHWYHQVGREPPVLGDDSALSATIRRSSMSISLLNALETNVSGHTASDTKVAEGIILEHGNARLYALLLSISTDYMADGSPYPIENLRPALYGDVEGTHFVNLAAAKLSTVMGPMLY